MRVWIELLWWHNGQSLAEHLEFKEKYFSLEASTPREVFEQLSAKDPIAQESFQLRFNRWGYLNYRWVVWVNRHEPNEWGISSEKYLDIPLREGDCISITSASGQ